MANLARICVTIATSLISAFAFMMAFLVYSDITVGIHETSKLTTSEVLPSVWYGFTCCYPIWDWIIKDSGEFDK